MDNSKLFALDIGTRSVVGIVGEKNESTVRLIASTRMEHDTRAMLDGQIHNVPEVAAVIKRIKTTLETSCGKLTKVAVAAAGRTLITIKSMAELDTSLLGPLTKTEESTLQLLAIQTAQKQLAKSSISDPTLYYCVGYSVIEFMLDSTVITSLVGQKGTKASIKLIATFLPRQVIDSMQSALKEADLEIATLTLEPIAAISVLIPHTMRHLNLALVDVGAGTSDIAITAKGSVIGYGMVPTAGDEITEAISQKLLLDFNVAEEVKRKLNTEEQITFTDVLGLPHTLPSQDIITQIAANVNELALAITTEILNLNTVAPQAVLLVGGGSLTPLLTAALAQALDILPMRVAVRQLDQVAGLENIPQSLCLPDAVTPLGILKIASDQQLNFVTITFNDQELRLFNLGQLTVADAILAAGIDIRSLNGHPGLGLTININNETRFIPGTHGTFCKLTLNDQPAKLEDLITHGDCLTLEKGCNGKIPQPLLSSLLDTILQPFTILVNEQSHEIQPTLSVNGQLVTDDYIVQDRDKITYCLPITLADVLGKLGFAESLQTLLYTVNSHPLKISMQSNYLINNEPAQQTTLIHPDDRLQIIPVSLPTLHDILDLKQKSNKSITILFNNEEYEIPTCEYLLRMNDKPAVPSTIAPDGSVIEYRYIERQPILSEALLAIHFDPHTLTSHSKFELLLNDKKAEFTTLIKNGDRITIK